MYSWGCNDEGALGRHATPDDGEESLAKEVELPDDVCVVQVSAGDSHSAALTTKGTVYAWGTYRVCTFWNTLDSHLSVSNLYYLSVSASGIVKPGHVPW